MSTKLTLWAIAGLAIIFIANGLYMLIDPVLWFDTTPGVKRTGAPNTHLIRDVGLVYAQVGIMMVIALQMAQYRFVLIIAGGAWLLGHAVFHFVEAACGIITWGQLMIDIPGVIVPGIVVPLLAFASRPQTPAALKPRRAPHDQMDHQSHDPQI